MVYYRLIKALLQEERFPKKDIAGKRILLVGGNDSFVEDQGKKRTGEQLAREWFLEQGAAECRSGGLFYQMQYPGLDYLVNVRNLAPCAEQGLYDMVIVFEGLEKTSAVQQAFRSLRSIVKPGGRICITSRTPKETSAVMDVRWYEDLWRFEPADMNQLFIGDSLLWSVEAADGLWSFVCIERSADAHRMAADVRLYSCKAGRRITEAESRSLGYFRSYHTLPALGVRYGTNKNLYGHNYLDKYEFLLRPLREQTFTLLELGVFNGGSERMWQEYFPLARIVGVDIDPRCQQYADRRIRIEIMDLGEEENLDKLRGLQPRLIIDDASHIWSHQILALFRLFPVLPSGGIYILEDMETSLAPEQYPGYEGGSELDAYTICERIARVAASKKPDQGELYAAEITAIGMAAEMVVTMKGACAFIRR